MKSLAELNTNKKSEEGFRFEYLDADGKDTGIFVTVIGEHATPVQKWRNRKINNDRSHAAMLEKRGKKPEVTQVEDDIEFGIEFVSIRIVAWEGLQEPCTPENALHWCLNDSLIVEQARAASENLANFMRSKSSSSSASQSINSN